MFLYEKKYKNPLEVDVEYVEFILENCSDEHIVK